MFLSTHINKIDAKGRVSVPSGFRQALANERFSGVVLFPARQAPALEGFGLSYMEEIANRLDRFDLFSDVQDDLATVVFGESVQLSMDNDGRIVLPSKLIEAAQLKEQAAFVGMGHKFQIWSPKALEERKEKARDNIAKQGLTIPHPKDGVRGGGHA